MDQNDGYANNTQREYHERPTQLELPLPKTAGANNLKGAFKNFYGELWFKEERNAQFVHTKRLIKDGIIPPPTKCAVSGTTNYVSYHNERYLHPSLYLIPVCWRVHMLIHAYWHSPHAAGRALKQCMRGEHTDIPYGQFNFLQQEHHIGFPTNKEKLAWFTEDGTAPNWKWLPFDPAELMLGIDENGVKQSLA